MMTNKQFERLVGVCIFMVALMTTLGAASAYGYAHQQQRTTPSVFGPVTVLMIQDLSAPNDSTQPLAGLWQPLTRTISLRSGMSSEMEKRVLRHERCHMQLYDMRIRFDTMVEEAICHAMMTAPEDPSTY